MPRLRAVNKDRELAHRDLEPVILPPLTHSLRVPYMDYKLREGLQVGNAVYVLVLWRGAFDSVNGKYSGCVLRFSRCHEIRAPHAEDALY